jgi:hypothetical protein
MAYSQEKIMTKTNLFMDIGLLLAFLVSASPHFTGNTVHEWLGVALAVVLIAHILLHWSWIVSVGARYLKNLWHVSRFQFFVDVLIFVTFVVLVTTGLMMSKTVLVAMGIQAGNAGRSVKMLHSTASNITVMLTGLHLALHWKWLISTIKTHIAAPVAGVFTRRKTGSGLVEINQV